MSNTTVQPATADTFISEAAKTTNYGSDSGLKVYANVPAGDYRRFSLLKFDFSSVVPAGATITLATLSLYAHVANGPEDLSAYRLLNTDWVEGQATWNEYATGNGWITAGALDTSADFTTDNAATCHVVNNYPAWHNFDVTDQVQIAVDEVSRVAHFKVVDSQNQDYYYQYYRSSNYGGDTCPKLYIEYDEAPVVRVALTGTVTTATEVDIVTGGKTIILTIANTTWITAAGGLFDAQRQNIIDGLVSAQSETYGWNAEVKAKIAVTDVVRTSDTVVTITLGAESAYAITADETITATIPSTATTINAGAVVATPTFDVTATVFNARYTLIT